jgi:hypothetical protein
LVFPVVAALAVFAAFASGFAWRSSHGLRSGSSVEADKAADLQARGAALELLDEALRAQREQRINGALSALDRARRTDPSLPGVDVSFAALALGEKQFAEMRTAAIAAKGKNNHAAVASVLLGMDKWIARGPSDREMSAAADTASGFFSEAIEADFFHAPAWFFWGDVLRYAGREREGHLRSLAALHRFNPWDSADVLAAKIVFASAEAGASTFGGFGIDDGSPWVRAVADSVRAQGLVEISAPTILSSYAAARTLGSLSDELSLLPVSRDSPQEP